MECPPYRFDKPRSGERVLLSIGYGALWVVRESSAYGKESEFAPVVHSGEPECCEVWNNLKGGQE
jgi:hypothetical protein